MEGVKEAKADFGKRRLEIVFDSKVVAEERIVQTAKGLGFTLVESGSPEQSPRRK